MMAFQALEGKSEPCRALERVIAWGVAIGVRAVRLTR